MLKHTLILSFKKIYSDIKKGFVMIEKPIKKNYLCNDYLSFYNSLIILLMNEKSKIKLIFFLLSVQILLGKKINKIMEGLNPKP